MIGQSNLSNPSFFKDAVYGEKFTDDPVQLADNTVTLTGQGTQLDTRKIVLLRSKQLVKSTSLIKGEYNNIDGDVSYGADPASLVREYGQIPDCCKIVGTKSSKLDRESSYGLVTGGYSAVLVEEVLYSPTANWCYSCDPIDITINRPGAFLKYLEPSLGGEWESWASDSAKKKK